MKEFKVSNGIWKYKGLSKLKQKEKAFEYIVWLLLDWWKEKNPTKEIYENDLSVLKVLKLMFFVSAINSTTENKLRGIEGNDGLLKIFDNWYAQPYGHVELDIYNLIRKKDGQFSYFKLTNQRVILQKIPDFIKQKDEVYSSSR